MTTYTHLYIIICKQVFIKITELLYLCDLRFGNIWCCICYFDYFTDWRVWLQIIILLFRYQSSTIFSISYHQKNIKENVKVVELTYLHVSAYKSKWGQLKNQKYKDVIDHNYFKEKLALRKNKYKYALDLQNKVVLKRM